MNLAMGANVTCPVCGVDIPCPVQNSPTSGGLTVMVDMEAVEEHFAMHRHCVCDWHGGVITIRPGCPVHS